MVSGDRVSEAAGVVLLSEWKIPGRDKYRVVTIARPAETNKRLMETNYNSRTQAGLVLHHLGCPNCAIKGALELKQAKR